MNRYDVNQKLDALDKRRWQSKSEDAVFNEEYKRWLNDPEQKKKVADGELILHDPEEIVYKSVSGWYQDQDKARSMAKYLNWTLYCHSFGMPPNWPPSKAMLTNLGATKYWVGEDDTADSRPMIIVRQLPV